MSFLNRLGTALGDLISSAKLYRTWSYLALQEMIGRYRRSLLGPLWIAGGLLTTAASLTLVFGGLFRQPLREFLPFVMSGVMAWTVISLPISEGPDMFVSAAGTIKTVPFPFMFYTFRQIARSLILLGHNLIVYTLSVLFVAGLIGFHWTFVPGLILAYMFVLVWSPVVGLAASRFRDLRFLMPYLGSILFFLTPIFWKADGLKGPRAAIIEFNPFYHVIELIREPLLGHAANLQHWTSTVAVILIGFVVWLVSFSMFRARIPFWI